MVLNRFLISVTFLASLFIFTQAHILEKEYPEAVPSSQHQPIKSRSSASNTQDSSSMNPREKKWSLYMIPDPPYGRGQYPYQMPSAAYPHYPYTHPRWVLERNSYPSDDFQFFYY